MCIIVSSLKTFYEIRNIEVGVACKQTSSQQDTALMCHTVLVVQFEKQVVCKLTKLLCSKQTVCVKTVCVKTDGMRNTCRTET